jgi:CheY-like chemotaxis protein
MTDPNRLRQVLINLIGNALKFTISGCITVSVELKNPNVLIISVIDTGIGIKKEHQGKLFHAFSRVLQDENAFLNHQGVGLGLMISHTLAVRMGPGAGYPLGIQVESEYGKGSKFWFLLENHRDETLASNTEYAEVSIDDYDSQLQDFEENMTHAAKVYNQVASPGMNRIVQKQSVPSNQNNRTGSSRELVVERVNALLRKRRETGCTCSLFLIVDDNDFNIYSFNRLLEANHLPKGEGVLGCEMALAKLQVKCSGRRCHGYELIFMDCEMPIQDGFETTGLIRQLELEGKFRRSIIIATTAHTEDEIRETCLKAGMDDLISKPIEPQQLYNMLAKYLSLD